SEEPVRLGTQVDAGEFREKLLYDLADLSEVERLFADSRNRHRFRSDRDLRVRTGPDPHPVWDSAFFQPPANFDRVFQFVHDVVSLTLEPRRPCSARNVDMRSAIARERGIGPIAASKRRTSSASMVTPKLLGTFADPGIND